MLYFFFFINVSSTSISIISVSFFWVTHIDINNDNKNTSQDHPTAHIVRRGICVHLYSQQKHPTFRHSDEDFWTKLQDPKLQNWWAATKKKENGVFVQQKKSAQMKD